MKNPVYLIKNKMSILLLTMFAGMISLSTLAQENRSSLKQNLLELQNLETMIANAHAEVALLKDQLNSVLTCSISGGFYNTVTGTCRSERDTQVSDAFHVFSTNDMPQCIYNTNTAHTLHYDTYNNTWLCKKDMVGMIVRNFKLRNGLQYTVVDNIGYPGNIINPYIFDSNDPRYSLPEINLTDPVPQRATDRHYTFFSEPVATAVVESGAEELTIGSAFDTNDLISTDIFSRFNLTDSFQNSSPGYIVPMVPRERVFVPSE